MNQKTEPTHTPGPWRIGDAGNTIFGPKNGNPSPERVATIHGGKIDQSACDRLLTMQANARLIAAAPELLEALKRVRHAFYVDGSSKALRLAFENTKELVAKAEGRI